MAPEREQDDLVRLRQKCADAGFSADWCCSAGEMEAVLWQIEELSRCGIAALRKIAQEGNISFEDPSRFDTSKVRWGSTAQTLSTSELFACQQACATDGQGLHSPPQQYADKLNADRNDLVARLRCNIVWRAMSLPQLKDECKRRGIPMLVNDAYWKARGNSEKSDLIQRLTQDTFFGAQGPATQKDWSPSCTQAPWTGGVWVTPEEPLEPPPKPAAPAPPREPRPEAREAAHQRHGLCVAQPERPKIRAESPRPFPCYTEPATGQNWQQAVAAMDGDKGEDKVYQDALLAVACLLELNRE